MLRPGVSRGNQALPGLVCGYSLVSRSARAPWSVGRSYVTIRPMSSSRIVLALVGTAGVALGVLAYRVQVDNLPEPFTTTGRAVATVVLAWAFLLAGLVAWRRRPGNRLGPLMLLACFLLLARQFRYGHDELAFTTFFLLGELGYVLVAHVALAYP